jgi:hypothetical protein
MKPNSIFSSAARLLALLVLSIGLTTGVSGPVGAQEGTQEQDREKSGGSQAKSASGGTKQLPCGGPSVIQCPRGMSCVDNPHDKCDPTKDGLNCPGTCVAGSGAEQKFKAPCGGPSMITCQGGMLCVDDPSDSCDPTKDGLNCKGFCVERP